MGFLLDTVGRVQSLYVDKVNKVFGVDPEEIEDARRDFGQDYYESGFFGNYDYESPDVPVDCYNFVKSQYGRFNIRLFDGIDEVIKASSNIVLYVVNHVSPYHLFFGGSDVSCTSDWSSHTYFLYNAELNPEEIETFEYVGGIAQEAFVHCMSNPGLSKLPDGIGDEIKFYMDEWQEHTDAPIENSLSVEAMRELERNSVDSNGNFHPKIFDNYFKCAAWAVYTWLMSPEGQRWLCTHNDALSTAYEYGECILHHGYVYPPSAYKKIARPPKSCVKCGITAWCAEESLEDGVITYICEGCTNGDLPPMAPYMCGTKMCRFTECHHHPFYSEGGTSINYMQKYYGQLSAGRRNAIQNLPPEKRTALLG